MARRRIDEFEMGAPIGLGTVGTIFRARDLTNGEDVALKILLPTVSCEPLIEARFGREMLILEKLSHKNIVRYFGGGRTGQQLFYAMELLTGGSLKDVMVQGQLSPLEAVACGIQVASALQHAHNHGVIHRDLKPSNLLFDTEGNIKIVDFGIARDTHSADITGEGMTVGSYAYMSPEQIRGDRHITGQVDLYSLGCVLFEMVTGRPPYLGENFAQLFEQHLRSTPPRVRDLAPNVPQELDDLVFELLQKQPETRPFNARAVQQRLMKLTDQAFRVTSEAGDVSAGDVVDRGRRSLVQRLRGESREVSWLALSGLLVTAAVLVLLAWMFGT